MNLCDFVREPFTDKAYFDGITFREVVRVFTRMLDNVVEINGLPLAAQREEIWSKRRHGMGILGLGSALVMLGHPYGSDAACHFTGDVMRVMALVGWEEALALAKEKGPAPILCGESVVTGQMLRLRPEMVTDGYKVGDLVPNRVLHARYSRYMQRIAKEAPELVEELAKVGARFTHHTSIAPTGTIALSLANNASNGIEPSFAHSYSRNVIVPGRKTKEKIPVYSFELLAYACFVDSGVLPSHDPEYPSKPLPAQFVSADSIDVRAHVRMQAAAQYWTDSAISKTVNVPTDIPYDAFKDVYLYAYEQGLKGCTTFRYNPTAFQGVLVKEQDLANTSYRFVLEDGSEVIAKGNEEIEYDGQTHTAANLFDALKEGQYQRAAA